MYSVKKYGLMVKEAEFWAFLSSAISCHVYDMTNLREHTLFLFFISYIADRMHFYHNAL